MSSHASGTFEVKLTPQTDSADATLGRMTIDKQFHGDIEGTSKGQMLTGMTEVKGSAGYVAIEKVSGYTEGPHRHFHPAAHWHHESRRAATNNYRGA